MAKKNIFTDFLLGFAAFIIFGCATSAVPVRYQAPELSTKQFKEMARQTELRYKETGVKEVDYRTAHGNFRCRVTDECLAENGIDDCVEFTTCLALAD